jgi:hypothetical protein
VTKLEFALKLEKYEKKQKRDKWAYFIIGIIFIIFAFIPYAITFLDKSIIGLLPIGLAYIGGSYLKMAWNINRGTEEHELLINALDLISTLPEPRIPV